MGVHIGVQFLKFSLNGINLLNKLIQSSWKKSLKTPDTPLGMTMCWSHRHSSVLPNLHFSTAMRHQEVPFMWIISSICLKNLSSIKINEISKFTSKLSNLISNLPSVQLIHKTLTLPEQNATEYRVYPTRCRLLCIFCPPKKEKNYSYLF